MARIAAGKIWAILSSRRFYLLILGFFVFESAWIALSAVYPQAFDEDFHFGLIKLYSHYWLPFLAHQPPGGDAFGAVARDPSYLFHYLMSFPYRLITLFTHNQTLQIILLRFIDIVFFGIGLILFRRILLRVGVSRALTNTTLFLFTLIPVVPLIAGQINYDNLLFPLVAWSCLLTFQVIDEIRQKKPSAKSLIILITVCLLTSLVKYAFLPIFAAIFLFVLYLIFRNYRSQFKKFWQELLDSFGHLNLFSKIILILILLLSLGMFAERDGVNLVTYRTIAPNCSQVLSLKQCDQNSIFSTDLGRHQKVVADPALVSHDPITYVGQWLYWMWYRLFFSINGPTSNYVNYPPLPLPALGGALIATLATLAIIRWYKRLFYKKPYLSFLALASLIYILALIFEGYEYYKYTGVLELMNGRYLLPVLLLLGAMAALAFSWALRNRMTYKLIAVFVAFILFMQGGGFLTFIASSDSTWYWPNQTVVKANAAVRHVTNHVVVKGKKTPPSQFWIIP